LSQSAFLERSQFIGSSDVDDKQMVAIANRVIQEMRDFFPWEQLRKEYILTMTNDTLYNLPSDFWQYVSDSGWQDEGSRPIELPVPDGRWYMYKNSAFSDGGTYRCRLRGKQIEIVDPDPGQKIVFYYVSKSPILTAAQEPKDLFTADSNTIVLDEQTFILGVQAHWAETKMLPQAAKWMANYQSKLNQAIGRSVGGRVIGGLSNRRTDESPYYPLYRT
jgi:hypothetical protein